MKKSFYIVITFSKDTEGDRCVFAGTGSPWCCFACAVAKVRKSVMNYVSPYFSFPSFDGRAILVNFYIGNTNSFGD